MSTHYDDKIDLSRHSFLLVDSNRYERVLLRNMLLQLNGKQIIEVSDAMEAMKILRSERVDFMMLEYDLPRVDGPKFVHGVRRGMCGRNNIEMAIFMMSSRRDADAVFKARNCGIHVFIAKPFSLQTMRDRIYTTLTRPPEFIRAEDYVGPDRREENDGNDARKPLFSKPVVHDMTLREPEAEPPAPPKIAALG